MKKKIEIDLYIYLKHTHTISWKLIVSFFYLQSNIVYFLGSIIYKKMT